MLTEEIWKPVKGYEGKYEVSNLGRIKSLDRIIHCKNGVDRNVLGELKKQQKRNGYLFTTLYKNGESKFIYIHRMVADAFLDNPYEYPCINHKDEVKTNNRADNLEWCSYSYNSTYGHARDRVEEAHRKTVIQMDLEENEIKRYSSLKEAAKAMSINYKSAHANISGVCHGRHEIAYGFKWKYAERSAI